MKRALKKITLVLLLCCGTQAGAICALPSPKATNTLPSPSDTRDPQADGNYPISEITPPYMPEKRMKYILPIPIGKKMSPIRLSLQEAILLALRTNPAIQNAELKRISDKFRLVVAHNEFEPKYTFTTNGSMQDGRTPTLATDASVSLKSAIGTTYQLAYSQGWVGFPGTGTVTITQPLLRGFGPVNLIAWEDALDNERVARLGFQNSVIQAVYQVITSYRALVQAYNNLANQNNTIRVAQKQLKMIELQYKAGQSSRSEVTQTKATLETTRLQAVTTENGIQQSYQTFLQALGVVPTANLVIDRTINLNHYKVPGLDESIAVALKNNPAYLQQVIQLNSAERAVELAKNNRMPTLNVAFNGTVGSGGSGGQPGILNPRTDPTYSFQLTVPIDDVATQQALIDAKIALEQAKINLLQKKENLVRQVMTQWEQIQNQKVQIKVAKNSIRLQKQSLEDSRLKLKYGQASAFEVSTLQNNLLQSQTSLIGTEVAYLNGISQLFQTLGTTLCQWNIKLRY